jgi:hypothetical protein
MYLVFAPRPSSKPPNIVLYTLFLSTVAVYEFRIIRSSQHYTQSLDSPIPGAGFGWILKIESFERKHELFNPL